MEIKKESSMKMPMGMKMALIAVVMALTMGMGINAQELFNKKIVEAFEAAGGHTKFYRAGVSTNGGRLADIFINIPLIDSFGPRLANILREGTYVSFSTANRFSDGSVGVQNLFGIGDDFVLDMFPPEYHVNFTYAVANQERLRREIAARTQAAATPAPPAPTTQETAEERRIRELEEELRRLREGR